MLWFQPKRFSKHSANFGILKIGQQLQATGDTMKGEVLKRLFRAVASDDLQAIQNMLSVVVEEEREAWSYVSR